ncbi:3-hydroxyisobutyrate dehydrogenase NAD-binding [Gracilaria domingensis]|nr:3-hydroxyisobutyrate dehydrogenase NAD-binding [Gracilaria domingensis]
MGLPMAANLAKSFKNLVVWNRSDKRGALNESVKDTDCKLTYAATPKDVVAQSDVTFSMLSTPEAVKAVFFEQPNAAINGVTEGKSIVDCSTLQIEDMIQTNEAVLEKGGSFLEAPVSGSLGPAKQGQLIFLCAGEEELYNSSTVQNALEMMGKKSFFLGAVGNGTKMKLVVNTLMATMLAALGEGIVLAESLELSVSDMLEVLSLGAMNNPMYALKGPKMKHGARGYETNFPLEHAQKDVRFAQALADDHGISMSVSSAANGT